ncbi:two component, sigma54 specific, transcriptional regulator, Fis family [Isosphaera pallida ATCC 43644]|uniref:Two component, sigma54 specific, transcriptional regulator, Fis family n=1 Tax=Isosphaera pallida (strain ATCC 43644 / DSM 9630 / IS1B) TaxID=575540 RepID=E8QXL5_ISOPI|nr:sigma-54 dependent transcriptional regulator [Isosphaera pallida]ADV63063.1 two component, sigma54 specific, transcriptional regulator, Fis family [Isosphaera pallida ATCC 43644]
MSESNPRPVHIRSDSTPRAGTRVLIVDDEEVIARTLQEFLKEEGYDVRTACDGPTALETARWFEPDLALCDVQLPGLDGLDLLDRLLAINPRLLVVMITAYATVENAVAAFQRGAHDYLMKPILFDELLAKLDRLTELRRLSLENQTLRRWLHGPSDPEGLVGSTPAMRRVKTLIHKIAPTRSHVLILGESGTGKELVARALHDLGTDPDAAFLAINCAAIPHDLLENQLFGHVKGAFTGADRDHVGLFAAAGSGTVFLDEIGEMPIATQAKLLRAIETREVLPIGANRAQRFEARVVAATNKVLAREVAEGRFREDLYYRLNVLTIELPPLRDRREDIPDLVASLIRRHAAKLGKRPPTVDPAALDLLTRAVWKGNVRELDNALERAMILSDEPILTRDDFPGVVADAPLVARRDNASPDCDSDMPEDLREAVAHFERGHIRKVLERCGGDKKEAARRLGLGLSSLYRKLEEAVQTSTRSE